jgi:putative Holliday junction resolvase
MQIIASGLTTVATHTLTDFIADIVIKENIECFVVGDPKNLDGTTTDSTAHVNGFVKRLKQKYPELPVHQIDERFTSKIAKQSILASGVKKKGRQNKALVDEVSATIILQNYLDYK